MSLDWNIGDIKDWETVCQEDDGTLSAITNGLIWATMGIGLGAITERNVDDFAWRLDLYQRVYEPLLVEVIDDEFVRRPITADEVRQHIGLHTNVSNEPQWTWVKRTIEFHRSDFMRYHRTKEDA